MATFNWSPNPYFVPQCYVSTKGNDNNDGSKNAPFRTIGKGRSLGYLRFQVDGVFRGNHSINNNNSDLYIFGEPQSKIDNINNSTHPFGRGYNITVINNTINGGFFGASGIKVINSIFNGFGSQRFFLENCFFNYSTIGLVPSAVDNSIINGNTFVNSNVNAIRLLGLNTQCYNNLFSICKVTIPFSMLLNSNTIIYSLFHNCSFNFNNKGMKTQAQLEAETGLTGIDAIRAAYNAAFNENLDVFQGCIVADPLFNAPDLDDYTLQPLSPVRNASYDGTYIGCYGVAFPTYAFADDLGHPNAFYNASANTNTVVANNLISLVRNSDGTAVGNGVITEKPKDLGKVYELKGNRGSYAIADRNGEMLDSHADIDRSNPISAGTVLTEGKIYINEGGSVSYNGALYPIRSRITAVDSVQSFTTDEGGVMYEVLEYPNRFTNEIRFKQNIAGTVINSGTALTANSWYRVVNDTVNWNGKTIPVGDAFQAITGQLSFTGNGAVVEEFGDADEYLPFLIDMPITVRRVGDVMSGAIDAGTDSQPLTNGHSEYYSDANAARLEFPVYARYVQKRWTLNVGMSK